MAETKKRIIQYNEELTPGSDDYLLLDSPTNGTRKILASNVGGSGGGGGVDYSTTEQDTGLKWIDGKPIYKKSFMNFNNEQWIYLTGLNIDTLVSANGAYQNGNIWYSLLQDGSKFTVDISSEIMLVNAPRAFQKSHATLLYTKTTDTV